MIVNAYMHRLNDDDIKASESHLATNLIETEVRRVMGIKHSRTRHSVMMGRIFLRRLLAERIGCEPLEVVIGAGVNGKPLLDATAHRETLYFNTSHSGDYVLVAVTTASDVGVDIEQIKLRDSLDTLAAYVMHPSELEEYQGLTKQDATLFFFRAWVMKEAYVKYLGIGIQEGLKSVHTQAQPAAIIGAAGTAVQKLDAPAGYIASIVFDAQAGQEVVVRQWGVNSVYDDLSQLYV